jgi:DNA-binding transcriptional ArsR family regulator
MTTFTHPQAADFQLPHILAALGDPVRLALVKQLASCPQATPMNCTKTAEKLKNLAPSTRTHHLRILREAGLIRSERHGVEIRNTLRAAEVESRFPGLLRTILSQR